MSGPTIKIPGQLMMPVPHLSLGEAVGNFEVLVRDHECNRQDRMALEQSVAMLRELVIAENARVKAAEKEKSNE